LGAFAKFAFAILDLTILIEDKAMAVVRSGTFCAARLQYKELLIEFPNENPSQLKEKFSYDSEKTNLIDSLRTSLEFGARFESTYIEALTDLANSVFANLIDDVELQDSDEPAMDSAEGLELGAYQIRVRLINLQELYDSGLLSSEEYQQQRRVIIEGI
jgi:hypothetical protein